MYPQSPHRRAAFDEAETRDTSRPETSTGAGGSRVAGRAMLAAVLTLLIIVVLVVLL